MSNRSRALSLSSLTVATWSTVIEGASVYLSGIPFAASRTCSGVCALPIRPARMPPRFGITNTSAIHANRNATAERTGPRVNTEQSRPANTNTERNIRLRITNKPILIHSSPPRCTVPRISNSITPASSETTNTVASARRAARNLPSRIVALETGFARTSVSVPSRLSPEMLLYVSRPAPKLRSTVMTYVQSVAPEEFMMSPGSAAFCSDERPWTAITAWSGSSRSPVAKRNPSGEGISRTVEPPWQAIHPRWTLPSWSTNPSTRCGYSFRSRA